jgi:hypothetical protein
MEGLAASQVELVLSRLHQCVGTEQVFRHGAYIRFSGVNKL